MNISRSRNAPGTSVVRTERATAALACSIFACAFILGGCAPQRLQLSIPAEGGIWRMYGGDRARSNHSSVVVVPPLEVAWEYGAGSGFGPCSPAVSRNTVFVGTLAGEVRAVSLESGEEVGAKDFGAAIFGTPLLLENSVIVALSGDGETLVSYNTATGSTGWEIRDVAVESSPLFDGGRIFVAGLDGKLRCIDALGGRELWNFEASGPGGPHRIRSSPSCDDSLVIFGSDGGTVYAVGRETGRLIWKADVGGAVFAPPAIGGGNRVFVSSLGGTVRALDLADGSLVWRRDLGAPLYGGAALGGDRLYAGTTAGEISAIGAGDGDVLWQAKTEGGISAAPLLSGRFLYLGDLQKNIYALTADAGEIVWKHELPGRVKTTPVTAGEYLLVLTDDRSLIAFRHSE